ncbi:hypothetical protein EIN_185830 [Entamoeba invadens IP1]|uniref:hypothetical protein n=1 Tax=Entamoeba invadens IP1 TaxID=370355 RepID=UPI0002C3F62A|nr:hypothetical protein EIN_185830 [Entamoeba invadens IP1]ELP94176.1 hypothetical protein EIN_185830 [Entamoeba invadens IP1]|eukprot:XP_004260947.1 hypothetical protein EIN_185830 [Entamoeba invadens IP1]
MLLLFVFVAVCFGISFDDDLENLEELFDNDEFEDCDDFDIENYDETDDFSEFELHGFMDNLKSKVSELSNSQVSKATKKGDDDEDDKYKINKYNQHFGYGRRYGYFMARQYEGYYPGYPHVYHKLSY